MSVNAQIRLIRLFSSCVDSTGSLQLSSFLAQSNGVDFWIMQSALESNGGKNDASNDGGVIHGHAACFSINTNREGNWNFCTQNRTAFEEEEEEEEKSSK